MFVQAYDLSNPLEPRPVERFRPNRDYVNLKGIRADGDRVILAGSRGIDVYRNLEASKGTD